MNGEFKKDGQEYHMVAAKPYTDPVEILTDVITDTPPEPDEIIIFQKSPTGTFYHRQTPQPVRDILDRYLHSNTRLFLDLGDPTTGQSWGEVNETQGTIGHSSGPLKVPLLIKTSRSSGGAAILDHCIVRIKLTGKNGKELYRHPSYKAPKIEFPQQEKAYADVL